jgi:hypothetical protein
MQVRAVLLSERVVRAAAIEVAFMMHMSACHDAALR